MAYIKRRKNLQVMSTTPRSAACYSPDLRRVDSTLIKGCQESFHRSRGCTAVVFARSGVLLWGVAKW
jgi:hypothetical protein